MKLEGDEGGGCLGSRNLYLCKLRCVQHFTTHLLFSYDLNLKILEEVKGLEMSYLHNSTVLSKNMNACVRLKLLFPLRSFN